LAGWAGKIKENDMETAIIEKDLLKLPEKIAKRLRGKRIEMMFPSFLR
jgi:predicted ABC-type transport system involved in lysophospholipase L1 biosynthesis ATPase subunit